MTLVKASTKLVRLISARADIAMAIEAHELFQANQENFSAPYLFESMVVSYGRPFFQSHQIGRLQDDYPHFPDFEDDQLNVRHKRLIDLRNKFVAHSSIEGTRVEVVPAGVINPMTGESRSTYDHNIGKRRFHANPSFALWLIEVAHTLKGRLENDIRELMIHELKAAPHDQIFELQTGYEDFVWTK